MDEGVALAVCPRIAERKEMFGFIAEGVFKGEFEAFLALRYAVLLKGDLNSRPFRLLLVFEDWQMALFEELHLIAHIRDHESGGGSLGETFG